MMYKRSLIILSISFLFVSLFSFYSLYENNGWVGFSFLPSRTLPILLLKSALSGIIITGFVHLIMFVVLFVKNHPGNKGTIFAVIAVSILPLSVILGIITVIPYAIYCIIRINIKSGDWRTRGKSTGEGSVI